MTLRVKNHGNGDRHVGIYASRVNCVLVFLFVCFFVRGNFVTDISGVGGRTEVKLWKMVDLGVSQVISSFW